MVLMHCRQGACAKSLDSLYDSFINNFEFLPEYYLKSDLSAFAFQKNAFFREQYLAESNTGLESCFYRIVNCCIPYGT